MPIYPAKHEHCDLKRVLSNEEINRILRPTMSSQAEKEIAANRVIEIAAVNKDWKEGHAR